MAFLERLLGRRSFRLSDFDLQPLAFEMCARPDDGTLVLDRPVARSDDSNVIALGQPIPTAGELRDSIERHLRSTRDGDPARSPPDPVDELREALADLRRSLR
jgi:hypothetical protein